MHDYYSTRLAGEALERCYALGSARVQQYLNAEIGFVVARLATSQLLLDLGCGYGRTLAQFAARAAFVVGIDTAEASLALARRRLALLPNVLLARMDASDLAFSEDSFDAVTCIQNGIAAFGVEQRSLVCEALRVLKPGGCAMFSSYSERFWEERLAWFEAQAAAGLIGEIDRRRTGAGVIVCLDGLTLDAVGPRKFADLARGLEAEPESIEVDESCWFHLFRKPVREAQG